MVMIHWALANQVLYSSRSVCAYLLNWLKLFFRISKIYWWLKCIWSTFLFGWSIQITILSILANQKLRPHRFLTCLNLLLIWFNLFNFTAMLQGINRRVSMFNVFIYFSFFFVKTRVFLFIQSYSKANLLL